MQLTNSVLINLSKKIDRGYPITAMATANFYLKPDSPIRLALARKARLVADKYNRIGQMIIEGRHVETGKLAEAIRLCDRGSNCNRSGAIPKKMNYYGRLKLRRVPARFG